MCRVVERRVLTFIDATGMLDTLRQMQEVAGALGDHQSNYGVSPRQLDAAIASLRTSLESIQPPAIRRGSTP